MVGPVQANGGELRFVETNDGTAQDSRERNVLL